MSMEDEEVVIVGGGIAGLATALALKHIGIQSLVLERSDKLRATGAALSLFPNAWIALDALGVSNKLISSYTRFQRGFITNIKTGTVQEVVYTKKDDKSIGFRTVHRSALLEALAEELPGDTIRFSSKLNSIETVKRDGMSFVLLSLEDGTILRAKAVIGCDGVHSVVGRWLGLKAPIDSGRSAVRGLAVYPRGHGLKHEINQFLDGSSRSGFIPLNDKELYWFVSYKSTPDKDADMVSNVPEMIQKSVLVNMADFPPNFLDVVRHSDLSTLTWAPLMFRAPWNVLLSRTYKDNVTVAGDAMHPTTPDLGQGGCASLEDAVVLARHIGNCILENGEIDSSAFEGYVKERRWRAAMLISASYLSGWIQQGGSGWLEFLRDKVFYKFFTILTSRVVNYDCGKLPTVFLSSEEKKFM
ncbi:hypothetical protein ACHQM5_022161 [Ranunculus cassubicifolius]